MARLSEAVGAPVHVKATTGERMGFVGREEGVAAMAVATLILDVSRPNSYRTPPSGCGRPDSGPVAVSFDSPQGQVLLQAHHWGCAPRGRSRS